MGKPLIIAGILLVALGILFWALEGRTGPGLFHWLGRLPGDIRVERPGFRFYFPLTTSLLLSAVLSLLLWVIARLSR